MASRRRLDHPILTMAGVAAAALALVWVQRRVTRLDLTGRVAIVTGGGRGLGLAITRELIARGCRVAICGRNAHVIEYSVNELRAQGADVFGAACDASSPDQVGDFVAEVLERFGHIDLLVNNAGQCFVGPAVELLPADLMAAFRNVFWVHYHPTMAVLPHMRARGFGRIANVTSFAGKVPNPHQAAYVAAKYAATGWSSVLSSELAGEGIAVSTITPPPLRDGAPLRVHFNGDVEGEFNWFTTALTSRWTATTAERTARTVVDALAHGDRERAVTFPSWLVTRLHGVAPNLMARVLSWVSRRMPEAAPPGVTSRMKLGAEVAAASSDPELLELARRAQADGLRYHTRALP